MKELWHGTRYYLLWFVSCALGFLNFAVALTALRLIAIALGADQWSLPAVHRFSLLACVVLMVIFLFWSEARYRQASQIGGLRLLHVFAEVTAGQLLLLLVCYLITFLPL